MLFPSILPLGSILYDINALSVALSIVGAIPLVEFEIIF
jgi:hypothetical protein